ncbi:MAG: ethylbenzene dehydrogenase-related protein, partial [Gemmobacter sp.]
QASWEWVQIGRDHGGARAFLRAGDRCSTCHARETATIGARIASGEILEPTPIPGKRGAFDLTVQAARDEANLYLRLRWPNAPHAPAPFVEGGKMDPEHPAKAAIMIAGEGIERVEQAGCWATCHIDSRYMPEAPDAPAIAASGLTGRLQAEGGITKYLPESRTEIDLKGKDRAMGGWDLLRAEAEIEAYLSGGTMMDLIRVDSTGRAHSGHVLDRRVEHETELAGEARLEGDTWTMIVARPLAGSGPGDVPIEPGRIYTVGFAVHDDYSYARFHHVSLDLRLSLDDPAAEIRVTGP